MRTLTELYSLKGRVYLYFETKQSFDHFTEEAKKEHFKLPVGYDDILAIQSDFSFCHPGWAGHMLFHNPSSTVDMINRVDYIKWISGSFDYSL